MESAEGDATTFDDPDDEHLLTGQYHAHPYGEINCVIPISGDHCELEGLNGWQHAGWTSPGPGSHHYPRVRNGALVALFLLPGPSAPRSQLTIAAGRISCPSGSLRCRSSRRLGQAHRLSACGRRRRQWRLTTSLCRALCSHSPSAC